MIRNYFLTALRNLMRYRLYAGINIVGLAIGLACTTLILVYVWEECRFDRFHDKSDHIYRITRELSNESVSAASPFPVGPAALEALPAITAQTRVFKYWFDPLMTFEEEGFYEKNLLFVDSSFSEVFDFEWIEGNPNTAFSFPDGLVLTESSAKKYFGDRNPMGEIMQMNLEHTFQVRGIVADPPGHSHIQFDLLAATLPLPTIMERPNLSQNWHLAAFMTYIVVTPNTQTEQLEEDLTQLAHSLADIPEATEYYVQPLTDIHLHSHYRGELGENGSAPLVRLLAGIALIILLLAAVNYNNLSLSLFSRRLKEIGVRKVAGGSRAQVISQFMLESLTLTFFAWFMGMALVELCLPYMQQLTGSPISLNPTEHFYVFGTMGLISLLAGLGAGLYPALFVSRFSAHSLMQKGSTTLSTSWWWKGLIVAQFCLAMMLVVNAWLVRDQVDYLATMDRGFNEEELVVLPISDRSLFEQPQRVKNQLLRVPGVSSVSTTATLPGKPNPATVVAPLVPTEEDESFRLHVYFSDDGFLPTLEGRLLRGRNFFPQESDSPRSKVIVNQAAVKALGIASLDESLGTTFQMWGAEREIIGVMEDFHFEGLKDQIEPLMLMADVTNCRGLIMRVSSEDLSATLFELEHAWQQLSAVQPFTYYFLDEDLEKFYKSEQRVGYVVSLASILAVLIAALGLFGLSAFAVQRRIREVGIRKVLGASVWQVVRIFYRQFGITVLLGIAVAVPLALWIAFEWLADFSYRIEPGPMPFVWAGGAVLGIALGAITWQSLRAAISNPVQTLRNE